MKLSLGLIVIKFVKKVKFEGAWSDLKAKNCLQGQPWMKHLRKALVFMLNSDLPENCNFCFSAVFCLYHQNLSFGRKIGH